MGKYISWIKKVGFYGVLTPQAPFAVLTFPQMDLMWQPEALTITFISLTGKEKISGEEKPEVSLTVSP
ncbi:hypothetical protein SDC9_156046 [bioreactor metagenome]|uniref:Uncharacterized protein n=1 Tax=bioreactor metagenome TaxID=1076179 RepID=A0A645F3E0_9ZZZZ